MTIGIMNSLPLKRNYKMMIFRYRLLIWMVPFFIVIPIVLSARDCPNRYWLNKSSQENEEKQIKNSEYIKFQDSYFTTLFIKDRNKEKAGIISISFKEKEIKSFLANIYQRNSLNIILIAVGSVSRFSSFYPLYQWMQNTFQKEDFFYRVFYNLLGPDFIFWIHDLYI